MTRRLEITPIAIVRSCFRECFGTPRQGALAPASEAVLELVPQLHSQEYFAGLESFSHAWLLWHFHKNEAYAKSGKVRPPRLDGKKIGVFASRTPHRPNPLGLTLVRILEVRANSLRISGLDLVDGTPIFDIKPYLPGIDSANDAKAGWTASLEDRNPQIIFSLKAMEQLQNAKTPVPNKQFQEIIIQSIALDPRAAIHRELEKEFFFQIYEYDVGFRWGKDNKVEITEIRAPKNSPSISI